MRKRWISLLWRCFILTNPTEYERLRDTFKSLWKWGEKSKSNVHRPFLKRGESSVGKNSWTFLISVQDLKAFCKQSGLSNAPGKRGCDYAHFTENVHQADFCYHILRPQPWGRNNFAAQLILNAALGRLRWPLLLECWTLHLIRYNNFSIPKLRAESLEPAQSTKAREQVLLFSPEFVAGNTDLGQENICPSQSSPLGQRQSLTLPGQDGDSLRGAFQWFCCFPHLSPFCVTEERQHEVEKAHIFREQKVRFWESMGVYTVCHARWPNYFISEEKIPLSEL